MAHYAFLDENNIVTAVIAGVDENITQTDSDGTQVGGSTEAWEEFYGNQRSQVCKRTSYNGNIRKNYAGIGDTYNATLDGFIGIKPFDSWLLNETTCRWEAPTPRPDNENSYNWDEETLSWIEIY